MRCITLKDVSLATSSILVAALMGGGVSVTPDIGYEEDGGGGIRGRHHILTAEGHKISLLGGGFLKRLKS